MIYLFKEKIKMFFIAILEDTGLQTYLLSLLHLLLTVWLPDTIY